MLAAALTTLPHAASAAASPNLGPSPTPHNPVGQGNSATGSQPSTHDLTVQQVHDIQDATKLLPENVSSFYTRGCDPTTAPIHLPREASSPDREMGGGYGGGASTGHGDSSSLLNSSDVFTDSIKLLQSQGGATSPVALLAAQAQILNATLQLSMYGQIASKASSGLQTMFNNQV
jgi:hypothetical protein